MYDPFNDYFGLSGLLSRVERDEYRQPSRINNDFNTNGVNVPLPGTTSTCTWLDSNNNNSNISPSSTGFLPLPLKLSDITELSRVMQNRGKNRGGGRAGGNGSGGVGGRPPIVSWCVFCKNNGESELVYGSHKLKNEEGLTTCPILRAYTCPLCGTNGDRAHTIKYCPLNKESQQPSQTFSTDSVNGPGTIGQGSSSSASQYVYRTPRTSTGTRRRSSSITGGTY